MTMLMRWDPMRDLWGMQRDLDRIMSSFGGWSSPSSSERTNMAVPSIDVIRRDEDLVIHAEMPGIKPEDIDISVTNGNLVLKGERQAESEITEEDYVVREMSRGSFERVMGLPEGLDPSTIHAEYHDGVLEVTIPNGAKPIEPAAVHVPITTSEKAQLEEAQH